VQTPEDKVIRAIFLSAAAPYHEYYPDPQKEFFKREMSVKVTLETGVYPSSKNGVGYDIPAGCGLDWVNFRITISVDHI
jgi:hypothetical protein